MFRKSRSTCRTCSSFDELEGDYQALLADLVLELDDLMLEPTR